MQRWKLVPQLGTYVVHVQTKQSSSPQSWPAVKGEAQIERGNDGNDVPDPHNRLAGSWPSGWRTSSTRAELGPWRPLLHPKEPGRGITPTGSWPTLSCILGSSWSQCSLRPVVWIAGMRGTCNCARPVRAAHHDAATAMLKARGAVYSASSLLGKTRCPLTVVGAHSEDHANGGSPSLASSQSRQGYVSALPCKHTSWYRLSRHVPESHMVCSCLIYQWSERHGFSRTEAPPRSANSWISRSTNSQANVVRVTRSASFPVGLAGLWISFRPEWGWSWPSIVKCAGLSPSPYFWYCSPGLLQWSPQSTIAHEGMLGVAGSPSRGWINQPIHRNAFPAAKEKSLSQRGIRFRPQIGHSRCTMVYPWGGHLNLLGPLNSFVHCGMLSLRDPLHHRYAPSW